MKNNRWFLCFDFETDGKNPNECNPVQLAAVPIDPDTLEIKKEFSFNVWIRPPGIDNEDYFDDERSKTIQWHADNMGLEFDQVVEKWKGGVAQKTAWKQFCTYCAKYEVDKRPGQWYPQPIPVGYNIWGYDKVIVDRLAAKHKTKVPFSEVTKMDVFDQIFWWMESLDEPTDFKMDTLRKFFGIESQGQAHDALVDVYEESEIFVRFLKFHRKQASVAKFKGSFKGVKA
jgi:hypothetical protein